MTAEVNPAGKTLRCLELIQLRPGVRADDLAVQLGISARAVRRHVPTLRAADIPIESSAGRYGGYRLGRGVRMPPLLFSEEEALSLTMTVLNDPAAAADRDDPVSRALTKLIQVLPGRAGEQAALLRSTSVTARAGSRRRPDAGLSGRIVGAVSTRRRVRIGYVSAGGSPLTRLIDPWAIVARAGSWYLLCHDHQVDAVRTYRLDRVRQVDVLDETFTPPADLDPVEITERHLGAGRRYRTRVRFEAPLASVQPLVPAVMGRLTADGDDRCLLTGSTDNPTMYAAEWLASLPFAMRIEGGDELLAAMVAVVDRLAASLSDRRPQ